MASKVCKCGHTKDQHTAGVGACQWEVGGEGEMQPEKCDCIAFIPMSEATPLNVTFEPTEWKDISTEKARRYTFPGQEYIYILEPQWLHVSASNGHRIIDKNGTSHYIPPTWIHLAWWVKNGAPNFVA